MAARKTHCIRNHEFTPENTYWTLDGKQRQCRACWNARYKPSPRAPVPVMPTDVAVLAYAAGIFDGEGSVSIRTLKRKNDKLYHGLVVRVTSTDPRLILWLCERFGGSVTNMGAHRPTHKAAFGWTMMSRHAYVFLLAVRPYLVIKGEQADLGIALQETMMSPGQRLTEEMLEHRLGLRAQLHRLNARGVPAVEGDAACADTPA